MKIKTINQIASTKTLTDKYGICSDENGNTNSFALADIVEPINELQTEVAKIKVNGNGVESISYPELVTLRNENKLVPGQMYRIIDYITTTIQDSTKSANHPFDIIVTALNENTLDEKASAIAHEEDTYFDGNDLSAWELWYDLDNDTKKYEWADATNGKGVIYRMIDEKRNDCPYDFKNILFYNDKYTSDTTTDKYYFTFSYVVSGVLYDGTVEKRVTSCYGNEMGVYMTNKKSLNRNVFRNIYFTNSCNYNTFGNHCGSNTFGYNCTSNTFGNHCGSNTFGYNCTSNTFGYNCTSNTFGYNCTSNTFGYNCDSNIFGYYCTSNTFGDHSRFNTFGNHCDSNTFGRYCSYNKFDNSCSYNKFDNNCGSRHINSSKTSITRNDEYYNDGNGKLVPVKHPDLSTQPSILPYKFMGQYVYEQLIPVKVGDRIVSCDFIVEHPMILSAGVFGVNSFKNIDIIATKSDALLLDTESELEGYINVKYTDCSQFLPSNGYGYDYDDYGYGYGNNNIGTSILIDFGLSPDGTLYIYDPNTEVLSLYKSGEITKSSIPQNLPKKNVILGEGVTSIGDYAFDGCSGLTSVTIPNSLTSIGGAAFRSCSGLTSITIPNSVTSIGGSAFQFCRSLTSITIPNSVMSIGSFAFAFCSGLTSIICEAINPPMIMSSTFDNVSKTTSVYVPSGSVDAYKSAQYWYNFTNIQSI